MNQATEKSENSDKKRKKKVFQNFAEYWHFVKILSEEQRKQIFNSLSSKEQKSLRESYNKGGWSDLFMRNACDYNLAQIKTQFNVDLIELRAKILSGKPQLIQKKFWRYCTSVFDRVPWEHISYIFDGIVANEYDDSYVKLSKFVGKFE